MGRATDAERRPAMIRVETETRATNDGMDTSKRVTVDGDDPNQVAALMAETLDMMDANKTGPHAQDIPGYLENRTGPQTPMPEDVDLKACKTCVSYRNPDGCVAYCNHDGWQCPPTAWCDRYERRTGC